MENKGIIRIEESDTKKIIKLLEEIKEENKRTISITTQSNEGIQIAIEKGMQEKKEEEIKIGKKITIKVSGGIATGILLDDKYSIDGLYTFKAEMDVENGNNVLLGFSPHEIEFKRNKEEAIF